MMTAAHIARLRRDTQDYVDRHSGKEPVKMSAIKQHVASLGWNLVDGKMFADWVSQNIRGSIDYQN